MSKVVEVPGVGNVEFPDNMSDGRIANVIRKQYGPQIASGPRPQSAAAAEPSGGPNLGGFASNVLTSAGKVASDLGTAIAHPIQTGKAMLDVAEGGVQKLRTGPLGFIPDPTHRDEAGNQVWLRDKVPAFDAFTQALKDRYGSFDALKKTAYEDPVGMLLDASALMSGGAGAAERAGLTTTAKVMRTAAEAVDPIRGAIKATGKVGEIAGAVAKPVVGKMTGTGATSLEAAAKGSPAFEDALRGGVSHEEIVDNVRGAVKDLTDKRQAEYQTALQNLPQTPVPTKSVIAEMRSQLSTFGVKFDPQALAKGEYQLDFSGSLNKITDPAEQSALQAAVDDLAKNAKSNAVTPLEMDALKQRLAQRIGAGGRADKILTNVKNAARSTLETAVPGYKDMTQGYAEASDLLDKITTEFSTKGGAAKEGTVIRKLSTALNQRNEFRKTLLETLDHATGSNIVDSVAGADMSSWMPRGLAGVTAGGAAAYLHNPATLAGLAMSSPRFVGEALLAIAKARKSGAAAALPRTVAPVAAPVRAVVNSEANQ